MPDTNIARLTTTDLTKGVENYTVAPMSPTGATGQKETEYILTKFRQWFGYYKQIPELKKAVDALAIWTLGRGYTADAETQVILEHMTGWGEDTFNSIMWNLLVMKHVAGDAFAEIIRDNETGELLNLKVLDPGSMKIITDDMGIVKRYEQFDKNKNQDAGRKFKPEEILHICNNRVADEVHGTSDVEACQWVIDARNEAMADWKRISHRATVRVLYVDEDDQTKLQTIKTQYKEAINKGEVLVLPGKPTDAEFQDLNVPPLDAFLGWIKYLENFFYQAVGIPKIILGGSEEFTEASSKIGYLTFEQIYAREQEELQADLWNQIFLKVEFNKPVSLKNEMLNSEQKNTGQVGMQPTEIMPGRNE